MITCDARLEDLVGVLAGDAGAGRGVLAVGDHEVGAEAPGQHPRPALDDLAAGPADDIADEEQFHSPPVSIGDE